MVQVKCFCGEINDSLEDLVGHTISNHSIKNKDTISPIVFDMIEQEKQSGDLMTLSELQAIKAKNKKKFENMRKRAENLLEIKYDSQEIKQESQDPLTVPQYE